MKFHLRFFLAKRYCRFVFAVLAIPFIALASQVSASALPNTWAELNEWYATPPEGENAATYYRAAFDLMQILPWDRSSLVLPLLGKGSMPLPGSPIPENVKSAINSFLSRNQVAWESLQKAANYNRSRYPLDLTKGPATPLPDLNRVRQAAIISALFTLQQADLGNGEQAANGVLSALAAARSLRQEPLLISQHMRVASQKIAVEGLEQAVNRVALSSVSLDRLKRSLKEVEEFEAMGTGFTLGLIGERVQDLSILDMPPEKLVETLTKSGWKPEAVEDARQFTDPQRQKAEREFCEGMFQQLLSARRQPFPERLKTGDSASQQIAEAVSKQFFIVSQMSGLEVTSKKEATSLAQLRLGLTAVALEQFRVKHDNHYPTSLGELAPECLAEVPTDPFDGQLLRYTRSGEGYELHSIGGDAKAPLTFKVVRPPIAAASASK